MSFLRYGLGNFRSCIWKEKFASVYQSTLAWYGQVWCFCDESPKIHGRRNKFRGCPCTRVHDRVRWTSLRARRCCNVVAWLYLDLGLFRKQCFAARPVRLQPVAASTLQPTGSSKQHARDTVKWLTMHDRGARTALAQAKKFLLSAPRCCGLVTSRSQLRFVAVVGENDSLIILSFSRQSQTGVLQLLEPFFLLVLGLKKKAPKRMVLKIDRRRVVLLSFFSPGTAYNSSWRHSPSHAKPCWLVAAIHPESTTNWPETKAIEHAPPFTGHEQGGRDFDFGNVSSPGPLIWLPSCFAKQQSGHSSVIVWFCFSRKSPQKMKKITSLSKQETENKNINEHSWSPFDCVTSRVTQQHSRRYFQLDLTMSCRESMLQLPATRGTRTAVPAICNHWTWRQNQSARNLNHFCRAPFRISGHFRWPITPLFFGIFLSFFHSMLSFHYLTSMHGKNLKVLCFKTAIWRTLIVMIFQSLVIILLRFTDFERPYLSP